MDILWFVWKECYEKRPTAIPIDLEECLERCQKQGFQRESSIRSLEKYGYISSSEIGHFIVDGFEPEESLPAAYLRLKHPDRTYTQNGEDITSRLALAVADQ